MTGEVYSILKTHSILGALMTDGPDDEAAFKRGLERSRKEGGVLHHLFSTRTEGLFEKIQPDGLPSYMSGILIGHELRNFAPRDLNRNQVLLVSEGILGQRYMSALEFFGIPAQLVSAEDATVRGLNILQQIATLKGKK
jgi:2-dehydro-3-deoxygalactonokinase